MLESCDWPSRTLDWARQTFGDIALDPKERAMRFLEEATELAHALGVPGATMNAITERVCLRSAGAVPRELGQSMVTLWLLARAIHTDPEDEAVREVQRIMAVPKEEWERRHAAKVAIGIAK